MQKYFFFSVYYKEKGIKKATSNIKNCNYEY